MLRWLIGIGLVQRSGKALVLRDAPQSVVDSLELVSARRARRLDEFLGEAPPAKVVAALQALSTGSWTRAAIEAKFGRNTGYALVKLGLMRPDGSMQAMTAPQDAPFVVAERARGMASVAYVRELLSANGALMGVDLGSQIAKRLGAQWSIGSQRRYGNALRQWAQWSQTPGISQRELGVEPGKITK